MPSQAASRFPAHVPTGQFGKCSTMCDHPGIDRDPDHETAVQSWKGGVIVRGKAGEVVRVTPSHRRVAVPVADPDHLVDVWVMPGGMHTVCLHTADHGQTPYGFLLAYVDHNVRDLANQLRLDVALAVDVWHFQAVSAVITTDDDARTMMRHLARAAAEGAVPFSPIRPEDRARWQVAVDTMAALVTRTADAAV